MWRRPLFRRTQKHCRRYGVWFSLVLGLGAALAVITAISNHIRPIMVTLATTQASHAITKIVNDTVSKTLGGDISYADMVTLEKDTDGRITALTGNSARMNQLQAQLSQAVVTALDGVTIDEMRLPLGNLTGLTLFSGLGPTVGVRLVSAGTGNTRFENQFTAAGVNQTLHRIMLHVSADIYILLPGETVKTRVDTALNLAETVIVGQVPDAYLQFGGIAP